MRIQNKKVILFFGLAILLNSARTLATLVVR